MDKVLHQHLARIYGQALDRLYEPKKVPQQRRVTINGDFISHVREDKEEPGPAYYVSADCLRPGHNYFEIEITGCAEKGDITVGLVPNAHFPDKYPGWWRDSVGYHSRTGKIYTGVTKYTLRGPTCSVGDFMGCGIRYERERPKGNLVDIFFTKNGKEIGSTELSLPPKDVLFPAVYIFSCSAEVRLLSGGKWRPEEDVLMCIDSIEEEWSRLHDITLTGAILEYAGRGKSIIDVGLAQAKFPLDTTHHYFEIEIMDPGENCYIAIGLARKDYPKYRHPGWNKGSIAYHADDGKIFVGSGVGDPFGPPCHRGDKMGCGIIFPRDFVHIFEGGASSPCLDFEEDRSGSFSESDEEEWWKEKENVESGIVVQVFFTRNRKTIGQKEVCIPKGGFYPTVGMLSTFEKVKVDLHPLTG